MAAWYCRQCSAEPHLSGTNTAVGWMAPYCFGMRCPCSTSPPKSRRAPAGLHSWRSDLEGRQCKRQEGGTPMLLLAACLVLSTIRGDPRPHAHAVLPAVKPGTEWLPGFEPAGRARPHPGCSAGGLCAPASAPWSRSAPVQGSGLPARAWRHVSPAPPPALRLNFSGSPRQVDRIGRALDH